MRDITDCVSCKSCGKCLTLLSRNAVYVNYIGDIHANGRVGADMGKPVSVDKIAYKSRNDDNDVTAGHTCELCYFENGRQRSAGVQRAAGGSVTFRGVPSGALYVLHDLDKGMEERIFTYVDGKVNWY